MAILHDRLPFRAWMDPALERLPGMLPLDPSDWLRVDAVYGAQMAERERLIRTKPAQVHALLPPAEVAARELLSLVCARLPALGFTLRPGGWSCPDGRFVADRPQEPLLMLGRLIQEDLCILQPGPDGNHVLTGAILCFPASWTLAQKIGRSLPDIHAPVNNYDQGIAARVQRMFDAIRPSQPLWRANALAYADPSLHQPRLEHEVKPGTIDARPYIRSERQCLVRLEETRAVVFSIHTYQIRRSSLSAAEEAAFRAHRAGHAAGGPVRT